VKVLITGGAGYIGSTIASACLDQGIEPVILDSLVTGRVEFTEGRPFYRGDIADPALLDRIFAERRTSAAPSSKRPNFSCCTEANCSVP
jgi:UDP-glucose 4-epimerase